MAHSYHENVGYEPPEGPDLWQSFTETGRLEDAFLQEALELKQLLRQVDAHPVWLQYPEPGAEADKAIQAALHGPYQQLRSLFQRHAGASSKLETWAERFRQATGRADCQRRLLYDLLDQGLADNPHDLLDWDEDGWL